jgi:hypothetical protein
LTFIEYQTDNIVMDDAAIPKISLPDTEKMPVTSPAPQPATPVSESAPLTAESATQTATPFSLAPEEKLPFWSQKWVKIALMASAAILIVGGFGFGLWESFGNHPAVKLAQSQTTPTPTPAATSQQTTSTTPSPSGCSGTPVISSFIAEPASVSLGTAATLSWDTVENADSVTIDNSIGTVSNAAGTQTVKPTTTTTYTMTATCAGQKITKTATVTIAAPFAVSSAATTVDQPNYSGNCPVTLNFTGAITTASAGTVTYHWQRSDGSSTSDSTETAAGAGTQNVTDSWSRNSSGNGWERVVITKPAAVTGTQANFTINCSNGVANFGGNWYTNTGTVNLTQNGTTVTGTYTRSTDNTNGSVSGTVSGNTLTATWSGGGNTGSFTWNAPDNSAGTFSGIWSGDTSCGAKSGNVFPNGCAFQGTWTAYMDANSGCNMNLTQNGTSVTGTYCGGTLTGTISYPGNGGSQKLSGTTGDGKTTAFYLQDNSATLFAGDFNGSTQWCGWRAGGSAPNPCLK